MGGWGLPESSDAGESLQIEAPAGGQRSREVCKELTATVQAEVYVHRSCTTYTESSQGSPSLLILLHT